jgi:hypothetical protein
VALAQADVPNPLALLRVHCKRTSDRGRCHAAEHHDEIAAAFQLIELHSVPLSTRAVAGYRIGVSQSGGFAAALHIRRLATKVCFASILKKSRGGYISANLAQKAAGLL